MEQIDVQSDKADSALEPAAEYIHNAAAICSAEVEDRPGSRGRQLAPTQGASTESLHPHVR